MPAYFLLSWIILQLAYRTIHHEVLKVRIGEVVILEIHILVSLFVEAFSCVMYNLYVNLFQNPPWCLWDTIYWLLKLTCWFSSYIICTEDVGSLCMISVNVMCFCLPTEFCTASHTCIQRVKYNLNPVMSIFRKERKWLNVNLGTTD